MAFSLYCQFPTPPASPTELLRNVTPPVYFKLSPQGSGTLASAQCDLGQHSSHDNESYWRQTGALGVLRGQDSSLLARLSSGQLKGTPDSRHLLLFFFYYYYCFLFTMSRLASNSKPSFYLCLPPECWNYWHIQPSQDLFCSESLGSSWIPDPSCDLGGLSALSGSLALIRFDSTSWGLVGAPDIGA